MPEGPDKPPRPASAIEQALGGLGGPALTPAGAPVRPWTPPGGLVVPAGPMAGPMNMADPFGGGTFKLSVIDGGLLRVDVVPPNPETYFELSKLPSRVQRRGAFGISFWDLPGVQAIAVERGCTIEYDAKVQDMIDRWHRWCLELEWIKSFAEFPDFHVPGLDIDFLPFQARGVNYGVKIGSFGLFDQMGTGKSIQVMGILFTHRQALGGRIETLLLSPTSVVGDWQAKFRRFAKTEIAVADGSPSKREKVYESKPEFLGLSYDTFMRDVDKIVRHFHPKAVVADEAQRITNRKSKATEKLIEFVDIVQPRYRIPMSGSPIMNITADLWPIMRLISHGLAGEAPRFEKRYTRQKPARWERDAESGKMKPFSQRVGTNKDGTAKMWTPMRIESLDPKKPDDAKLLSELRMKIAPHVIRRLKKDVLKDLPEKMFERIDIRLSKREREVYEELQVRFAEAMAGVSEEDGDAQTTNFLEWFTRAQQICSSLEIVGEGKESSKIDELRAFCEDYAEEQKILIFSRFKEMTTIVCRELKQFKPIHLNGDIPQSKRQPLVDLFQENEDHRLFVSTLKAGGVGLTLTAGSIVVRLDRWVSPAANDQAVDRAHRIGQTRQVTVVDFVVEDSIEERILEILDKKLKMIASLISADDDEEKQERKIVRALLRKQDMLALI